MYEIGDRDIDLITRTILGEAAREPTQGKAGVAHVIMNRLRAGNYGKSIPDVLFAPKQFEPWNTRRSELEGYGPQTKGWDEAQNIAKTVARGLAPDPTGGALNFLNRGYSAQRGDSAMRPGGWGNNMDNPIQIGGHTFGTAAGAGTGREGRIRVASADPNFVPGGASAAPAAATGSPTMPMGGLGGLGGYQQPTGMQTFGDILQALGMSMLSSPNNNMFQGVPTMMTAIQGRRGKEAETAREAQRWGMEFGLKTEDLEARRAENAIDNARQERALKIQEQSNERSGHSAAYNTTRAMYKDLVPGSPEFLEKLKEVARAGGSDEVWGTTQSEGVNEKGETVKYITSNKGNTKVITPDGVKPMPRTTNVKTATENLTLDQSGNIIKREPLNVAQGESEKKQGQSLGEQIAGAPAREASLAKSIKQLDDIKNDPAKYWSTGIFSLGNSIPGGPGIGFEDRVKQAKAGAFAEGVQVLKGFGSLTEKEGDKAEMAQQRMNTATSEAVFDRALSDYREALVEGQMKIKRFMAQNPGVALPGAPAAAAPPPGGSGGGRMRFDANGNPI